MGPWSFTQVTCFRDFAPLFVVFRFAVAAAVSSTSLQFLVAERLFPGSAMRAVMQKV